MLDFIYWGLIGIILSEYIQLISDRGSFLKSIVGRSVCDHCHKEIPWYALIPFIGAGVTGGKCVNCGKKVARKYFWFELLFSLGWVISLYFLLHSVTFSIVLTAIYLLFFSATALLMYEDYKNFSVPVFWLGFWGIITVLLWYLLNFRSLYYLDAGLMGGVILLSLMFMTWVKRLPLSAMGDLFGSADIIVLLVICFLFGFQVTTAIFLGKSSTDVPRFCIDDKSTTSVSCDTVLSYDDVIIKNVDVGCENITDEVTGEEFANVNLTFVMDSSIKLGESPAVKDVSRFISVAIR